MKLKPKNLSLIAAGLLGSAAFAVSCSSDKMLPEGMEGCNAVIEARCLAPFDITGSRTSIDPGEYVDGVIGINWEPGDLIGAFGDKGTANAEFHNALTEPSTTATFGGTLKDGETVKYAYYPYSATAGNDPTALRGNLPAEQTYNSTTRALTADWKVSRTAPQAGVFSFSHLFSFFRFEVNAAGTELSGEKLWSIALTIDGKQLGGDFTYNFATDTYTFDESASYSTLTMNWEDRPDLSAGTYYGYMTVRPVDGIAGKTMTVKVITSQHIATFPVRIRSTVDRLQRDCYYTLALDLERFAGDWTLEDNPDAPTEENAAWVPGLESRLACANTVFALPGKPFMHKIRVPKDPSATAHAVVPVKEGVVRAYNLPEGLTWNAERCLVEGTAPAAGEYAYSVEFTIDGTTYREGIRLTVSDNLHQPTPHMGWQSWNVLETKIDESSILAVADALVSSGYAAAGYTWLGIDDCWQKTDGSRDSNGVPNVNTTKFPNGLKYVTDYIHSKGLKAGIYSDAGTVTCASGSQGGGTLLGAYGYESQIAAAFTEWGFDKLKEDWFWSNHGDNNGALDPDSYSLAHELYGKMGNGIQAAGNKILLSMCEWGIHDPWRWAAEVGGSSWRMSYDHRDGWMGQNGTTGTIIKKPKPNDPTVNINGIGLKNTIDLMRNLWSYVGINRFNDADMLCVGIRGTGTSSNDLLYSDAGMSDTEYETEFAMWCMWSSPLLLTLDVRKSDINSHDVALLKNADLIAINQDPMGQGAEWIKTDGNLDYYQKDLANGDVAIAVVNLGDSSADCAVSISDFDALDKASAYTARGILNAADATLSASSAITASVAAHGTAVWRLTAK